MFNLYTVSPRWVASLPGGEVAEDVSGSRQNKGPHAAHQASFSRWARVKCVWLAALCIPVLGCQVILDVEGQQCESDRDCVGLFGRDFVCTADRVCIDESDIQAPEEDAGGLPPLPDNWACLREPPRMVNPLAGRTVSVRFAVTDFVELTVPPGLTAKACESRDIRCENPVIDDVTPDSDGFIEFENLPHGWRGYSQLSAPDYVDSLVFTNRPYTEDTMPDGPTMLTPDQLQQIAMGGNEDIDMTKGIAILTVYDCDGNAAPGVRFEQDDSSNEEPAFYFSSTLPDRERPHTTVTTQLTRSMKPLAVGGFSHIEPGYVTMVAILDETEEEVGRVIVQIRALNMTFVEINAGY